MERSDFSYTNLNIFFKRNYRKALILNIAKYYISFQQSSSKDYEKDNSINVSNQETGHCYKYIQI